MLMRTDPFRELDRLTQQVLSAAFGADRLDVPEPVQVPVAIADLDVQLPGRIIGRQQHRRVLAAALPAVNGRRRADHAGLGGLARIRFRRKAGNKWERKALIAAPRSAYLLTGPARSEWEHSIPAMEMLRYSITFRTLAPQPWRSPPL